MVLNATWSEEVACIVSKHLVSCLWGCGESVNPPRLNIQEVQGGFVLQTKGRPRPATHSLRVADFYQTTPLPYVIFLLRKLVDHLIKPTAADIAASHHGVDEADHHTKGENMKCKTKYNFI